MKRLSTIILLLLPLLAALPLRAANVALSDLTAMPAYAASDLLLMTDVSDTTADLAGTSKKATFSAFTAALSGLASSQMADADWGSFTLASGTATIDTGAVTAAMLADADWGAISIASGVASIDANVVTAAMLADGDWGDFTIATNSATLDAGVVDTAELAADAADDTKIDWGTGANQVSGADVPLADAGTYFATDNVEAALQEVAASAANGIKKSFFLTIDDVADSMDYAVAFVDAAFTITEIRAVHAGSGLSTPDIDVDVRHSTDRSAAGNQVDTTALTVTSSTSGNSFTSGFEDATVPADSWIWIETSSKSGTTDNLELVIIGTYD